MRIINFLTTGILSFSILSLSSCVKPKPSNEDSDSHTDSSQKDFKPSGKNIVENGSSNYKILIPAKCDDNVKAAASETQNFLYASTGIQLAIQDDSTQPTDFSQTYISFGQTSLWKAANLELSDNLKLTGHVMETKGSSLLINAKDGNGVLAGAYDFLKFEIGLECYAEDEVSYDKYNLLPLYDFHEKIIPTTDVREILSKTVLVSPVYNRRLRLYTNVGLGKWAAFAHTTVSAFLPTDVYMSAHPDYYGDTGGAQVCYSNEGMRKSMEESIKKAILKNPNAKFLQIGHEDNTTICNCPECRAERLRLSGYEGIDGYSAQELEFTNKVQEELAPWLKEQGREDMQFVFFAYQTSAHPPVHWDENQKKYVANTPNVRVNPNVMVMYAPITMDFSKEITDPVNKREYEDLKGWADLMEANNRKGAIYVWTYCTPAKAAFVPFNNFGAFANHYRTMSEIGCDAIMDQGVFQSSTPSLEAMKLYTQAKILYDNKVNYEEIRVDFMNHYYGLAVPAMERFYHQLRAWFLKSNIGGNIMGGYYSSDYWNFSVLKNFLGLMEEGAAALDPLKDSDPNRYRLLQDRMGREKCFPIFLLFRNFMNLLSPKEQKEYWFILDRYTRKYNIITSAEGSFDVETLVQDWRTQIFTE